MRSDYYILTFQTLTRLAHVVVSHAMDGFLNPNLDATYMCDVAPKKCTVCKEEKGLGTIAVA